MRTSSTIRSAVRGLAFGAGLTASAYACWVAMAWRGYGHPARPEDPDEQDALLDRFMPAYDVAERHRIAVAAPPAVTLEAAREMHLFDLPVARTIFRAREIVLGSAPDDEDRPKGLLAMTQSIGWRILAETPGREIVVGAVTKPWEPNPVFRGVDPGAFAAFDEPDYVKIVWTLRADPDGPEGSVFRTETRAVATDVEAALKFRRYWAFLSAGIILIRQASLRPLKRDAERRARSHAAATAATP
ncbi:MAG: hypothetical protein KGN76_04400 [Acidobacteriota bacterium]|nr:hypothetical protein [Acidobacteriota bacterium]